MEEIKKLENVEESHFMKLVKFISDEHTDIVNKVKDLQSKINYKGCDLTLTQEELIELTNIYSELSILRAKWNTLESILNMIETIKTEEQLQEYTVVITEILKKKITVKAKNEDEAKLIVENKYYDDRTDDVVLSGDNWSSTGFTVEKPFVEPIPKRS